MNSLNILSARVIGLTPPPTPTQARRSSYNAPTDSETKSDPAIKTEEDEERDRRSLRDIQAGDRTPADRTTEVFTDEKTALLSDAGQNARQVTGDDGWLSRLPKRLADTFLKSLRWFLTTLASPSVYVIAYLYDDGGRFRLRPGIGRRRRSSGARASAIAIVPPSNQPRPAVLRYNSGADKRSSRRKLQRSSLSAITNSQQTDSSAALPSDSENPSDERERPVRSTRSTSHASTSSEDYASPARRSIRIKLYNEDTQRGPGSNPTSGARSSRERSTRPGSTSSISSASSIGPLTAATLKSPTSPTSSLRLTRYPRAPNPPRPLIPRRTPSYDTFSSKSVASIFSPTSAVARKTLILDLDETLIHSMAKGGRMSTGHMVEVKLNSGGGFSGGVAHAPQHPILYYVHKRPHCDDFLRNVSQWYTLIAFTASVQEYADPVIDWLEQDRKYFSGRYYRQHCTFRGGNYIKDISSIEPDLSRVMIVDNSPSSYVFHEDNAIPIEGWINDPTDNDLLHLIPLLECLQHVTDVRALLALRAGEPQDS